jgi:signal transduction histidine kinase
MAKRFIRISLALKIRLLFGLALLGVITAALLVPWYFMEILSEQRLEGTARELTRLRLNEWLRSVVEQDRHVRNAQSAIVSAYTTGANSAALRGPLFISITGAESPELDQPAQAAVERFLRNPEQQLAWRETQTGDRDEASFRCFRAVRNTTACSRCHNEEPTTPAESRFRPGQLVGLIDVTLPETATSGALLWWTRGAFVAGGVLAGLLAMVIFSLIANRIILRPMRLLRDLADKVAEGDQTVRSSVRTGDELEHLGNSFNDMLDAIEDQHNRLRSANRALDLKLNELGEVNVALYEANLVKTEFLANISHELRTPLNSIIGFADLLSESDEERTSRYGRNIATASKNLLTMINDMLDLAKIEAGRATVRSDKVSVLDTCQTLLALMQPLAEKKNITLQGNLEEDLPVIVTDPGKVQQILYNLMSNAIKFTPAGGQVTLQASGRRENGNGETGVTLAVSDTGPGITESEQAHIFDKFYQSDATLTRESTGAGLGLAISKELASLLGGRLTLDSEPGRGTTFTLSLPLEPPEPSQAPPNRPDEEA